jgi:hypothetical protein
VASERDRILAAKTAHAIWVDRNGLVPWQLADYSAAHLSGLFAKATLFNPQSSTVFYFVSVVDYSPTDAWQYVMSHGLLRASVQETIQHYLDQEDEKLAYLAKEIWDHPEIGLQETFAANLLANELEEAGFRVERASGHRSSAAIPFGALAPLLPADVSLIAGGVPMLREGESIVHVATTKNIKAQVVIDALVKAYQDALALACSSSVNTGLISLNREVRTAEKRFLEFADLVAEKNSS